MILVLIISNIIFIYLQKSGLFYACYMERDWKINHFNICILIGYCDGICYSSTDTSGNSEVPKNKYTVTFNVLDVENVSYKVEW